MKQITQKIITYRLNILEQDKRSVGIRIKELQDSLSDAQFSLKYYNKEIKDLTFDLNAGVKHDKR